jgi:hypothetical protein
MAKPTNVGGKSTAHTMDINRWLYGKMTLEVLFTLFLQSSLKSQCQMKANINRRIVPMIQSAFRAFRIFRKEKYYPVA